MREQVKPFYFGAYMKDELLKLFDYNKTTGDLIWKVNRGGAIAGSIVSCRKNGYIQLQINRKNYYAHRIIWLIVYGEINPNLQIDHINGIRDDNRIANLRCVTNSVNQQNTKYARRNNKSKVLGVFQRKDGRYFSTIGINGKYVYLGNFGNKEDAHKAYIEAKRKLHEGCTI